MRLFSEPWVINQADHFFGALRGGALILKVWAGNANPRSSQSLGPCICPVFFTRRAIATHAHGPFGTSSNSSDQQLRKARVIRDLAPLRENYLTRASPTSAQLLPLSINKLPLFHQ